MRPKFAVDDEEAPPEARDENRVGNLKDIVEGALAALGAEEGDGTGMDYISNGGEVREEVGTWVGSCVSDTGE